MDDNPQAYLVPHPEDCTKFYSCQNLGNFFFIFKNKNISQKCLFFRIFLFLGWRGGYIAHLMDCPPTTGFDTKLRICNYIRALPRCNKGMQKKWKKDNWLTWTRFEVVYMSSKILQLAVGYDQMIYFMLKKKNYCCYKLSNSKYDHFEWKQLSFCEFAQLVSTAFFFLSLR